nr:hypothetical protein [Tanacetum cinerariifolium]
MFESRRTTIPFPSHFNDYYSNEKKGSYGLQCLDTYSYGATRVDNSLPRKEKDPESFTLPCYINNACFENSLADLGVSVSVMPLSTYLNLGLGELAHTKLTVQLADKTVKHLKGIAENVLVEIGRLMGETLVLNRSLDPLYGDYIELNDLNVPLELRRDQVTNLTPTIKEAHFVVVENINGYRDQEIGDVIFGESLSKASCMEAKRFDGLITIHNGNDNVTYQMARSHPRLKHPSNSQCNKIRPLLKVSVHDKLNGISHPYQKLKSFYREVLNLGPEYI